MMPKATTRTPAPRARCAWLAGAALVSSLAGCQPPSAPKASAKAEAPAKVSNPTKEDDLATITLAPEAEQRLGIELVEVERKPVARVMATFGDVVVPPGRTVPVSAPFAGSLAAPSGGVPAAGARVKKGQPIFVLAPFLSPEARSTVATTRVEAEGQIEQAKEGVHAAQLALDRAEDLLRRRIGSPGAVKDAQIALDLAKATQKAAEDRREALTKAEAGTLKSWEIVAPADGVLRNVNAQVDEKVTSGALLFEVMSLDTVWIKVPVYVGDQAKIEADKEAGVGNLADLRGYDTRPARPVPAPPSADPVAVTTDLYYEVENAKGILHPGERVGVTLPLRGQRESLVVPRSALLLDFHGGEWVYENLAPHKYARRRVEVDRVLGSAAVLARGPRPGAKVVTEGAAELFGTEFGPAK